MLPSEDDHHLKSNAEASDEVEPTSFLTLTEAARERCGCCCVTHSVPMIHGDGAPVLGIAAMVTVGTWRAAVKEERTIGSTIRLRSGE